MDRPLIVIALIRYQRRSLQSVGHLADSLLAGVFDKLPALIFLSHYTLSDCKPFLLQNLSIEEYLQRSAVLPRDHRGHHGRVG